MKMKNMKIGRKLGTVFGVTVAFLLVMGVVGVFGMTYSGSQFKDYYTYSYPMSLKTSDMRRSTQEAMKALCISLLTEDQAESEQYIAEVEEQIANLREILDYLKSNYRGDTSRIDEGLTKLNTAGEIRKQIQELSLANKNTEAGELYLNSYVPAMLEIQELFTAMDENTSLLADETYENARRMQTAVTAAAVILAVIIVAVTISLALYLSKSLTGPISEIENAAKEMSQGSLSVQIGYESQDELGCLAASMQSLCASVKEIVADIGCILAGLADGDFHVTSGCLKLYTGDYVPILTAMRLIRDNLNDTLTQINQSADQVAAGATQMAEGAQNLAEGATEQAGAVEELTATVENVSNIAQESAASSEKAYQRVYEAEQNANGSQEDLQSLTNAMERISNTSKEIQNIIASIEDIASQTNLLSLNASIEAARAGEAGRGFAVVADQIGKLASDSAQSAVDTRELIIKALEEVDNGNRITLKTVGAIEGILESMKEFAASAKESSELSKNQADMLRQVEQGIEQISRVVQSNSASAQETSATSEELSAQSESLKEQVSKFRLLDA